MNGKVKRGTKRAQKIKKYKVWFWDEIRENKGEKYLKMKGMKLPRAMLKIAIA